MDGEEKAMSEEEETMSEKEKAIDEKKRKEKKIIDEYLEAIKNASVCFPIEITIDVEDCSLVGCPYLRGKNGPSGHEESTDQEEINEQEKNDDKGKSSGQVESNDQVKSDGQVKSNSQSVCTRKMIRRDKLDHYEKLYRCYIDSRRASTYRVLGIVIIIAIAVVIIASVAFCAWGPNFRESKTEKGTVLVSEYSNHGNYGYTYMMENQYGGQ